MDCFLYVWEENGMEGNCFLSEYKVHFSLARNKKSFSLKIIISSLGTFVDCGCLKKVKQFKYYLDNGFFPDYTVES